LSTASRAKEGPVPSDSWNPPYQYDYTTIEDVKAIVAKAIKSVKGLKRADITEIRAFKTPPKGVRLTIDALCILFSVKPVVVHDPMLGKREDYWPAAQSRVLKDAGALLAHLLVFDKEILKDAGAIPRQAIKRLLPYIENPDFRPGKIRKASEACVALCVWVRAMFKYHQVVHGAAGGTILDPTAGLVPRMANDSAAAATASTPPSARGSLWPPAERTAPTSAASLQVKRAARLDQMLEEDCDVLLPLFPTGDRFDDRFVPLTSLSYLPSATSVLGFLPLLSSFLPFLPCFLASFLPSFLPSFLLSFLLQRLSSLPSFLPSYFLPSFPSFLPSSTSFLPVLPSFLFLSFLPSFLPPSLHSIASSLAWLPSFHDFLPPVTSILRGRQVHAAAVAAARGAGKHPVADGVPARGGPLSRRRLQASAHTPRLPPPRPVRTVHVGPNVACRACIRVGCRRARQHHHRREDDAIDDGKSADNGNSIAAGNDDSAKIKAEGAEVEPPFRPQPLSIL
jgi:hypothetical protein